MEINFTPSAEFLEQLRKIIREEMRAVIVEYSEEIRQKPRYLTREEAAKVLRVSPQTLINWDRDGILRSIKLGNRVVYNEAMIYDLMNRKKH